MIGGAGGADLPSVENPPACSEPDATMSLDGPSEGVGVVIGGRYKLLETLGQGGMGHMFMARRTPARSGGWSALELIKRGMDSRHYARKTIMCG